MWNLDALKTWEQTVFEMPKLEFYCKKTNKKTQNQYIHCADVEAKHIKLLLLLCKYIKHDKPPNHIFLNLQKRH